jgi:imidazolonepropionase-like amidohydrolase
MKKLIWVTALSLLLACVGAPRPRPPLEEGAFVFVDVNVVPMDSERIMIGQTVVVRGGTIVAIGASSKVAVPVDARVVDGRRQYLMPGLADMYAHLVREEDLALYAARGVTTCATCGARPCTWPGASASREASSSVHPS